MLYIRILKYLKKCVGQGILYSRNDHLIVKAYIDARWAGSKLDRSSTTGYCITLGVWNSKKQPAVAKSSSIKALHQAIAPRACEFYGCKSYHMSWEFNIKKKSPIILNSDSASTWQITINPVFPEHIKHIGPDVHFMRENIENNDIKFKYLLIDKQSKNFLAEAVLRRKLTRGTQCRTSHVT